MGVLAFSPAKGALGSGSKNRQRFIELARQGAARLASSRNNPGCIWLACWRGAASGDGAGSHQAGDLMLVRGEADTAGQLAVDMNPPFVKTTRQVPFPASASIWPAVFGLQRAGQSRPGP